MPTVGAVVSGVNVRNVSHSIGHRARESVAEELEAEFGPLEQQHLSDIVYMSVDWMDDGVM